METPADLSIALLPSHFSFIKKYTNLNNWLAIYTPALTLHASGLTD